MSATAAAVNPAINAAVATASAPSRPAAAPAPSDEDRFDRHLDAARQQHGDAHDEPAQDDAGAHAAPAKTPSTAKAEKPAKATETKADAHPDDATLAAAMLALIGHAAVPVKPFALAAVAGHAAAKALAGAQAHSAGATALTLLGVSAASTPAGKPSVDLDTAAAMSMLAKPAEQKDAPLDAAQLASLQNSAPASPATTTVAPAHALEIASPAGTPAFAQELGQHVVWLGLQDVKQARIRLHPEDLGTLDVKVSMNHDRVDVSFAVQHPAAVHVVQQTLPQLDALLAHHGLSLGQTDVGQRQQQGNAPRAGEGSDAIGGIDAAEPAALGSTPVSALGLLDTFA